MRIPLCVCVCVRVCVCTCICVCVLYLPVTVFHTPATNLSSAFEQSDVLNISDVWVLLLPPQSLKGGCLVTPRRCLPSAADEEWYSLKRPYSTVVESNNSLTTQR